MMKESNHNLNDESNESSEIKKVMKPLRFRFWFTFLKTQKEKQFPLEILHINTHTWIRFGKAQDITRSKQLQQ